MVLKITFGNKKMRISELLKTDGYVDIIEIDKITNKKGLIGVSNKYVNCKAIIIIYENKKVI